MERIGLVTFSTALDNYGQVLQALATQKYLQERGHKVFLIREYKSLWEVFLYNIKKNLKIVIWKYSVSTKIKDYLKPQIQDMEKSSMIKKAELEHPRYFEIFRKENFAIITNSKKDLRNAKISVLCSGSDQIWSWLSPFFFLQFGDKNMKRIAVASSTGNKKINEKETLSKWLHDFSLITVRENSGIEMCIEAGYKNASLVLDPTFLIDDSYYNELLPDCGDENDEYLFVYMLNANHGISIKDIFLFAQKNKLKVKYVSGQGQIDSYDKIYATVPEWILLLRNAKYVVTNSFHGMVFSIIYKKPFLIVPRVGNKQNMNERIVRLAQKMGLDDRIYKENLSQIFNAIDFSTSQEVIAANKLYMNSLMSKAGL